MDDKEFAAWQKTNAAFSAAAAPAKATPASVPKVEAERKIRVEVELPRAITLVEERANVPGLTPAINMLLAQLEPEAVEIAERQYADMRRKLEKDAQSVGVLPISLVKMPRRGQV